MNINKNRLSLFYIVLTVLCCILICFSNYYLDYNSFLALSGVLVIFHFIIFTLFSLSVMKIKLFSIVTLFVSFLYLFNFGNLITNLIDQNYIYSVFNFLYFYSPDANIVAIKIAFLSVCFVTFGIVIFNSIKNHKYVDKFTKLTSLNSNFSIKKIRLFAYLILITSFPLELYISVNKLLLGMNEGYLATYNFQISGILIQFAQFYIIGFILLAISYKDDIKKVNIIYLIILMYQLFVMMSGNRGIQTIIICILVIIYFGYFTRPKLKSFVLLFLFALLGIFIISGISRIRNTGYSSLLDLFFSFIESNHNPVLSIFDEFGFTLYTTSLCVAQQPNPLPFTFGATYFASLSSIIPNIFEFTNELNSFASFATHLNGGSIGGSLIAELYYNFSYLGPLFGILIGYYVATLSHLFSQSLEKRNYFMFSLLVLPSIQTIWWIRDSFSNFPRMIVYSLVYLFLINELCNFIENKVKS